MFNLHTDEELVYEAEVALTLGEVAKRFGVSRNVITRIWKERKLPYPTKPNGAGVPGVVDLSQIPTHILSAIYQRHRYNGAAMAKELRVTPDRLRKHLATRGIIKESRKGWNAKTLRYLHHDCQLNLSTIARMYDSYATSVRFACVRYGIEIRRYPLKRRAKILWRGGPWERQAAVSLPEKPCTDDAWEARPMEITQKGRHGKWGGIA